MRPRKALIIDDNEILLSLLTEVLTDQNFDVVAFSDPFTFIQQQEQTCCHKPSKPCYDIIISDNLMPGMTGIEFFERLDAAGCKLSAQRKAIISGNWATVDLARAERIKCKVFYKPVELDILIQWLEECTAENLELQAINLAL